MNRTSFIAPPKVGQNRHCPSEAEPKYPWVRGAASLAMAAALLLTPALVRAQLPRDPAERARLIAQILETQARQLTVYDRQGRSIGVIGPRDLYNQPVLSPDGTKVAVVRPDLDKESNDLWILDVASARRTQLTTSESREGANSPTWSPDGRQVAYVALRKGFFSIYRKNADGTGAEELIHQGSFPITLTDWSHDGQYLSYFAADLAGAGLYSLPLNGDRKPIEVLRSKFQNTGPRLSPDNKFMAFVSNSSGRTEVYVVPFNPKAAAGEAPMPIQISDQGGTGMTFWRKDGKELFYLAADRSVMSVEVGTGTNPFGKPKVLWRPAADILTGVAPGTASVSRDGEKFVIAVPRPQLRQLTVYDRSGKAVTTVAEAGFYNQPGLSPDGTRAVVMRNDPRTGNADIWVVDLASGKGTPITSDTFPENAPIWSPDGKQVAYVSTREGIAGIYRKAADGTGEAELLFQYTPGAGMVLTDWSSDNKFMTFFTGVVVLVPIGDQKPASERKEIDWLREDYDAGQGRFSPDNRWIAFLSNEANQDRGEVWVRPFDPSKPESNPGPAVQVTKDGAIGMIAWRQDGKELYYMTRDWEVMAVEITSTPTFKASAPKKLFQMPGPLTGNPMQWKNVSPDGQRFIFAMPSSGGQAAR
jgi:Tol biopolymer transport system component